MNNRVLVIVGGMINRLPHVELYLREFDNHSIGYDTIEWNRNSDIEVNSSNKYFYTKSIDDLSPFYVKLKEVYKFAMYVKGIIKKNNYERIVTFTVADSLYLMPFLVKHYKNKYIFDIRDFSPLCKIPFMNSILKWFINNSYATCISSEGFKNWLPKGCSYIMSHNINLTQLGFKTICTLEPCDKTMNILTIGKLRDFVSNRLIIDKLSKVDTIQLDFVGDGYAKPFLQEYCEEHDIQNVSFYGYYKKEDEASFYNKCDMLNICLTNNTLSNHLMSNRFYLSVIHRKPMIVNLGTYQAEICKKYGLGCVIDYNGNIIAQIQNYLSSFDKELYEQGCNQFLIDVEKEQECFQELLVDFAQ